MNQLQKLYAGVALFSTAGLVSSFWQLLDKLEILASPGSSLSCNLNSVFNCGKVLNSSQYEIFGFPNAMLGLIIFSFFLTFGLSGWTGSKFARRFALFAQLMALFMLGFVLWFLFESTYRIKAVCLFCTVIGPSVLVINALMLRANRQIIPFARQLKPWIDRGADIFFWAILLLVSAFAVVMQFTN